jgi:GDP-4-dehydro-6-deoxy-D-mannose reductase
VIVVRPFNVIGVGMPEHGAVQMFARQIADIVKGGREPIVEVGNLDATRDFVTVEAVVEAYWRLVTTPAAYGQIINVCSGVATSLRHVLEMLVAAAGIPIAVKRDPARVKTVDIDRHCGSPSKLCAILGESAPVHLEPALRRIVDELVQHP